VRGLAKAFGKVAVRDLLSGSGAGPHETLLAVAWSLGILLASYLAAGLIFRRRPAR
jgi:hypothetical protein